MKGRRKARLDKVGTNGPTEFIGFGAFGTSPATDGAATATPSSSSTTTTTATTSDGRVVLQSDSKPKWSPVYTGRIDSLQNAFQRISQKRDGVTKTKALTELANLFLSAADNNNNNNNNNNDVNIITKWEIRVNALPHWMWLYSNKLVYENKFSSVRAASLQVWQAAFQKVPKAVIAMASDELWGMWFTTMVDPMQEVRQEGQALVQLAQQVWNEQQQQQQQQEDQATTTPPPWFKGVLEFSSRILGYGRPSVMYQALFARTNLSGGAGSAAMTEDQKEEAEERFSYLVGYVLDGLCMVLQDPNYKLTATTTTTPIQTDPPNLLFRCMASPIEGLRVRTYRLVSIIASSPEPSMSSHLLHSSTLNTLVQSLSSEKSPNAWPVLLEAFLGAAVTRTSELAGTNSWHKGLVKALRKACYGASVASWGPILLPLTSTLSSLRNNGQDDEDHAAQLSLEIIQAAWEGQHVTLGMTEAGRLAIAVSETAYYMLVRPLPKTKQQQQQEAAATATTSSSTARSSYMSIAEIWLEVLENALTDQSLATANAKRLAWEPLLQGLAKQLQRYQDHSAKKGKGATNNAFALIQKEFWAKVAWPSTHPEALAYFVTCISSSSSPSPPGEELAKVAKSRFQTMLAPFQGDFKSVPTLDVYEAMQALVRYHPKGVVTERFVFNDLLRWIVLHTSQLSHVNNDNDDDKKDDLVRADFNLLAAALQATDHPNDWWSTILREVIASQPNLHSLTIGIKELLLPPKNKNQSSSSSDWIHCDVLDDFSKHLFPSSSTITTFPVDDQLDFCQTVLGINNSSSNTKKMVMNLGPVVRKSVWEHWIRTYKEEGVDDAGGAALPQILLQMTQVPQTATLLNETDIESIVLKSWLDERVVVDEHPDHHPDHDEAEERLSGGFRYMETVQSIPGIASRVVQKASAEMKRHIETGDIDSVADWGLRGWRLVQICQSSGTPPSLSLVGLDQIHRWQADPLHMYELSLSLCHHMDENKCFELLKNTNDNMQLFLAILAGVCEASVHLTAAARVSHCHDRAATFLRAIGASSDIAYLDDAIDALIQKIAKALDDEGSEDDILRQTAVLTILLRFSFQAISLPRGHNLAPFDIKAGDHVWYVSDPKSPNDVEPVTVAKVHHDALTGYYFTIEINRNGNKSERQTVINRLRKTKQESPSSAIPADESRCASVREKIVSRLLKPHFASADPDRGLGEIVSTLISRLGLGEGRGIGTTHFELFKLLSEEEKTFRSLLNEKEFSRAAKSLWKLSLSFGFGRNSEMREGSFHVLSVDPVPSHKAIVNLYGDPGRSSTNADLDRAVLAWISVSIPAVQSKEKSTFQSAVELAYTLAKKVISGEKGNGFTSDRFLAVKALSTARRSLAVRPDSTDTSSGLLTIETDAFGAIIESFVSGWGEENQNSPRASQTQPAWKLYSDFPSLMEDTSRSESGRELLGKASTPFAELLVDSLFDEHSRPCTFILIDCIFRRGEVLRSDQEILLGESTSKNLKEWTRGMDQDAVLELEEDIEVVSQWLPLSMMHELETWHEETFEDLNEAKTIGRLLTWLLVINLIETVAPKDFRARPAFVSYLTKAEIVPAVLNVSILFDETMNSAKSITPSDDIEAFDSEGSLSVSNLAKQVIFRTFETVPSLCRRWWEEECPKVYTSRVQSLVERQVAPEILKREMKRLKEASFGEMSVSGSLMSREITASYMQDDFTLTVLIRLPTSFPLRSAEVDCSRTLGVPTNRWKRWSLQITLMLNNQGGTLQDALMLWKDNVDKEFEGVEPCPVCYSVLHVKTHKLPSLECTTCHNRFHVDCLTQWFKQSGKSQCVLCQQDWRGARV